MRRHEILAVGEGLSIATHPTADVRWIAIAKYEVLNQKLLSRCESASNLCLPKATVLGFTPLVGCAIRWR